MKRHLNRLLVVIAAVVAPLFAQLHLITGSPNPSEPPGGFESALFRVGEDGKLVRLAEIVPAGQSGHDHWPGCDWYVPAEQL